MPRILPDRIRASAIRAAVRALVLLGAVLGMGACGRSASPEAAAKPPFRWGGDAEGGAPFVEADPADPRVVRGFDVEIAGMIARGLGANRDSCRWRGPAIEQSVERGDFEIGMSGVEDRPELRERYALTMPYFEFREVLAVRPADRARYRTLADLAGRRVGTLGATMAYDILLDGAEAARAWSPSRTTTTSIPTPTWWRAGWMPCCWTT